MQNPESISYLTQREAAEVDEILMGPLGFSVDQLMVTLNLYLDFFLSLLLLLFTDSIFHFAACFSFRNWLD
jgi:hypothetical protein